MVVKTSGNIIVVIVKSIIVYSTVNHIAATKKKKKEIIHKNGTKNLSWHLLLMMVKLGRSPPGSVFYRSVQFQILFKLAEK